MRSCPTRTGGPPPDAVGDSPEGGDDQRAQHGRDQHDHEHRGLVDPGLRGVAEVEHEQQVEERAGADARAGHQEDLARVGAQHLDDRGGGQLPARAGLLEVGALRDGQPHDETDDDEHGAEQERDPPAPGEELVTGQRGQRQEDERREDHPDRAPHLRPAAEEASPAGRRVLDRHEDRATPLAAEGEPLQEAQDHQEDRGGDPDRGVRGSRPMSSVAAPISSRVDTSIDLRPMRSP